MDKLLTFIRCLALSMASLFILCVITWLAISSNDLVSDLRLISGRLGPAGVGPLWLGVMIRLVAIAGLLWMIVNGIRGMFGRGPFVNHDAKNDQRLNTCKQCGYDLSGINSVACPECGVSLRATRSDRR